MGVTANPLCFARRACMRTPPEESSKSSAEFTRITRSVAQTVTLRRSEPRSCGGCAPAARATRGPIRLPSSSISHFSGVHHARLTCQARGQSSQCEEVDRSQDWELFDNLRNNLLMELSPQTLVELMICDRIVAAQWKLRRLNTAEAMTHDTNSQRTVLDHVRRSDDAMEPDHEDDEIDAIEGEQRVRRLAVIMKMPWPQWVDELEKLLDEHKEFISPTAAISMSFLKDDGLMERLSRYEQPLELSIHRNLKQLEKVKKQTQQNKETRRMHCPFIDQKFYDDLHEQIEEHEREMDGEDKATEEKDEEAMTTKSTRNTENAAYKHVKHDASAFSSSLTQPLPTYGRGARAVRTAVLARVD